jgi:hypothetical protein
MANAPRNPASGEEPLPLRRPWLTALLLGSAATPAAVILAVPAPAPLDALLAWPLVVVDRWVASHGSGSPTGPGVGPLVRLAAILLGILLTWLHYVLLARFLVWRIARRAPDL